MNYFCFTRTIWEGKGNLFFIKWQIIPEKKPYKIKVLPQYRQGQGRVKPPQSAQNQQNERVITDG